MRERFSYGSLRTVGRQKHTTPSNEQRPPHAHQMLQIRLIVAKKSENEKLLDVRSIINGAVATIAEQA